MTKVSSDTPHLILKKGILAILIMYAGQLLAGIAVSYGFKFFSPTNEVPLEFKRLKNLWQNEIEIKYKMKVIWYLTKLYCT